MYKYLQQRLKKDTWKNKRVNVTLLRRKNSKKITWKIESNVNTNCKKAKPKRLPVRVGQDTQRMHEPVDTQDLQMLQFAWRYVSKSIKLLSCVRSIKSQNPVVLQLSMLTADAITTVWPASRPFIPAWMLMQFVQKIAKNHM
jgi:hypothetical protein